MNPVPKPVRIRDDAYTAYIRAMPCLLADRDPCTCGGFVDVVSKGYRTEVAHVRSRGAGGGDEQTVPLCHTHHAEAHRIGHKSFEARHGLNLAQSARMLRDTYLASPWP